MSHLGVTALTLPSPTVHLDSLLSVKAAAAPLNPPSPIKTVQGGQNKRDEKAERKASVRDEEEEKKLATSGNNLHVISVDEEEDDFESEEEADEDDEEEEDASDSKAKKKTASKKKKASSRKLWNQNVSVNLPPDHLGG